MPNDPASKKTPDVKPPEGGKPAEGAKSDEGGTPDAQGVALADHDAAVAAAREAEAAKHTPKVATAKQAAADAKVAQTAAEAKAEELEAELQLLKDTGLSADQKLDKRLEAIEAASNKANAAADKRAERAEKKVAAVEMKLHREAAIRESGMTPASAGFVTGNTPEAIAESILEVKAREDSLRAEINQQVRDELAASGAGGIPKEPAAKGEDTGNTGPTISLEDRTATSKLKGADYAKARRVALDAARSAQPAGSRFGLK